MSTSDWSLPPQPVSVPFARSAVRSFLSSVDPQLVSEAAVLVVSELVSNAVLHARPDPAPIELHVQADERVVHIEVRDHDPDPPRRRHGVPGPEEDRGRGLHIVHSVADDWGWDRVEGNGKIVWCDLPPARSG